MRKRIAIYGVGLEAEKFYWNNLDKFEIAFAIDRKARSSFHGIKVYSVEYAVENLPREFIVVTALRRTYQEIRKNLREFGLVEFKDFIWCEFVNRELVVLYGNCHMIAIEDYLMNNPYFCKKYVIKRFCVTEELPRKEELQYCRVLISQDVNEQNKLGVFSAQEIFNMASESCTKVLIPNLYGCNLFFPQLYESGEWKKHLFSNKSDSEGLEQYEAGVRRIGIADENIRKLWREGRDLLYIVDVIQNGEVYKAEDIISHFNQQMEKIKKREAKCDIQISDYIENNYRDKKLFYEPGHPSGDVLYEMGRRICKLLHIEYEESFLPVCRMDTLELFIYGCVCRALNLNFKQDYVRRKDHSATIYNRPIDLEEYVRQSVIWLYEDK